MVRRERNKVVLSELLSSSWSPSLFCLFVLFPKIDSLALVRANHFGGNPEKVTQNVRDKVEENHKGMLKSPNVQYD